MNEILYLTWRNGEEIFNIGEFTASEDKYYFKYDVDGVKAAMDCGFELLKGFPRVNSKYFSEIPFKLFSSWISSNRKPEEIEFSSFKGLNHDRFTFVS